MRHFVITDENSEYKEIMEVIEAKQEELRKDVIGQFIKCRKDKKITQTVLSQKLGTKRPNITRFENGSYNPTLDFLVKIAEGLDMDIEIKLVDRHKK